MAVGRPAPTSRANVGPDSTATRRSPSTSRATWCGSCRLPCSKPLVAHATCISWVSSGASCVSSARNAVLGTTMSTSRAPPRASGRCGSTRSESGKIAVGR